jgi:hypothetical protein
MFWSTVGHASRQTAREMGPSTMERSNFFGDGWMRQFYIGDCRLANAE